MCLRFPMPEKRNKVKRRKAVLDNQNKVKDEITDTPKQRKD